MILDRAPTSTAPKQRDQVAGEVFDRLGGRVVLAAPLGVGKPVRLVNALYRHAREHPDTSLTIVTALTLDSPSPTSELARRLGEPIAERLSGGGPEPAWPSAQRDGELPENIEVRDLYSDPGRSLSTEPAQQSHVSADYHHVTRLLAESGVNALAQLVSPNRDGHVSLGTNPDISLRLLDDVERRRADGETVAIMGEQAREMPHLGGHALIDADRFDVLVEPVSETPLFGIPNPPVGRTETALGCLAAALIRDGGTLQIGIGALGDAVAAAAALRHRDPERFGRIVRDLAAPEQYPFINRIGGRESFSRGVYVSTEMLSDSLIGLLRAGVASRRVNADPVAQDALNRIGHTGKPTVDLLHELHSMGIIGDPMTGGDVRRLADAGILRMDVSMRDGRPVTADGEEVEPVIGPDLSPLLASEMPGPVIHAAFALGSPAFYGTLRDGADSLPVEMVDVGFTNTLLGDETLKRAQRKDARFVNATMQVTCLGEVASDTLPDGRVVSGVGGQHDFVAQAHELKGARSITVARATRTQRGSVLSNIVWQHPHPTVPRHLRDVVVTEYGIADLRGKTDAETIAAMIEIADARFQVQLMAKAKKAGKLPDDYEIPKRARMNLPQRIDRAVADDPLPRYPFGTILSPVEDELRRALSTMAEVGVDPRTWPSWGSIAAALGEPPERYLPHLRRMGLEKTTGWKERLMTATVVAALEESGVTE